VVCWRIGSDDADFERQRSSTYSGLPTPRSTRISSNGAETVAVPSSVCAMCATSSAPSPPTDTIVGPDRVSFGGSPGRVLSSNCAR
jgi:hypothetical protein